MPQQLAVLITVPARFQTRRIHILTGHHYLGGIHDNQLLSHSYIFHHTWFLELNMRNKTRMRVIAASPSAQVKGTCLLVNNTMTRI